MRYFKKQANITNLSKTLKVGLTAGLPKEAIQTFSLIKMKPNPATFSTLDKLT